MFIRPNEFETQLATTNAVTPVYRKSHRAAGAALLLVLVPLMIAWLALLACWTAAAALVRAPIRLPRLLCDAADFGGWLVLR